MNIYIHIDYGDFMQTQEIYPLHIFLLFYGP